MLVLTRGIGETVELPELGITITLTKIKGNKVRLGVDAPREHRVVRGELLEPPKLQEAG